VVGLTYLALARPHHKFTEEAGRVG
jgi:hypothetical protein